MKTFIPSLALYIIILFFPFNSYAQNSTDCWTTHMIRQYSVCTNAHTECLNPCSVLRTTEERKVCFADCGKAKDLCTDKAVADYKTCVEASRQSAQVTSPPSPTKVPTAVSTTSQENNSAGDETACHESCQANYDSCTSQCKSQEDPPETDDFDQWLKECANRPLPKTREELEERDRQDEDPNSPCFTGSRFVCDKAADDTCLPGTERFESLGDKPKSSNTTFSNESCLNACEQTRSTCDQECREKGQTTNSTKPSERSQVGVSSNDFQALARANAELQKAQAELEKIKAERDPRYEAKKEFSVEYSAAFKGNEKLKEDLQALRADLETVHELFSKTNDYMEIEETIESIKMREIGDYGKLDFFTDATNSFNTYHELRAKGVSAEDATTKATLDNFGTSALTLVPVLKAIDLFATTPDFILEMFGVDEKNWSRKYFTGGLIGKFAPSGVVEQTTELMIEDDWSDIGNALAHGWGKVQSAEGVLDTTYESVKLLAGTVGAVPVAIAQGLSDVVGGGLAIGEKTANFVWSWFTYPN